jgi:hypothetical protein
MTKGLVANVALPVDAGRERVSFTGSPTLANIIRNPFDEATIISTIRFAKGTEFDLQAPITSKTLAPGNSLSVPIYFRPTGVCQRYDTLIVTHNGQNSPLRIPVVATGTEPGFLTTPLDTLDFGNVIVNVSTDRVLKISNVKLGSCIDSTRVTRFRILPTGSEFSSTFVITSAIYLQPNAELPITISVNPTSTGVKVAQALIDHEILGGSITDTVVLIANSVQPAVTPKRNDIVFARTDIGGWQDTLAVKFLENFSGADVDIESVSVTGPNSGEFIYRGSQNFQITSGSSLDIPLTFLPVATGNRTAVLELKTNIPSTISIALSGNAAQPSITSRRKEVVFEPTDVNDCRDSLLVRYIVNTSLVPLRVSRIRIGGVPPATTDDSLAFSVVRPVIPPDSLTILPGDSVAITLRFCPKRPGVYEALLHMESNADSTLVLRLLGPAKYARVVRVDSVVFTPTRVLTTRDSVVSGMIFNHQNGRLDIFSMQIVGSDATSFQLLSPSGQFSIAQSRDTSVKIQFRPMRRGAHVGELHLSTSQGEINVLLLGEAIYPFIDVHPNDPASMRVRIGTKRRLRIDISNSGNDSARIEEASIIGSSAYSNVSTGPFPARLMPGESLPIYVDFEPNALCEHDAKVELRGEGIRGIYAIADTAVHFAGIGTAPLVSTRLDEISFGSRVLASTTDSTLPDFLGNIDFSGVTNACLDSTRIDSLVITGPSAGSFGLIAPVDPLAAHALAPDRVLPLVVRFNPATSGLHSAMLLAYFDGSADSVRRIRLIGAGTALPIEYGPVKNMLSLDFKKVTLGLTRDSLFTATNISSTPLLIDSVTVPAASDFQLVSPPSFPLVMEPNVPITFKIRFTPVGAIGIRQAAVAFHGSGIVDSSFGLFGAGVIDQLRSNADTIDFGVRIAGSINDTNALLINDITGAVPDIALLDTARIDRVVIASGSADFQVVAFPLVVLPGGGDRVTVRFAPNGIRGIRRGILRVYYNSRGVAPGQLQDSLDIILIGTVDGPSNPIRINLGSDINTRPGEHELMPVSLAGELGSAAIRELDIVFSYRKTMVRPVGIETNVQGITLQLDSSTASNGQTGEITLHVASSTPLQAGMIASMQWFILLGDRLESTVRTDSISVAQRPDIDFQGDSVTVSIAEFCNAQRRLIRFDSLLSVAGKPNPADKSVVFDYTVPALADVNLSVYNPLGYEVARLADGEMEPGSYTVALDASTLDEGTYFCLFRAGIHSRTFILRIER